MTMLESARFGFPFLAAGQAQKELTHNEAVVLIDAGLHAAVESAGVNAPPSSPEAGQCWIVGAAPEGAWAGAAGALACWTASGWRFLPPTVGMHVWVKDQQLWALLEEGVWTTGEARAARLVIGGEQLVGPRQPAVAAPSGGAAVDAEARTAIAAILDRLKAHGLIAP